MSNVKAKDYKNCMFQIFITIIQFCLLKEILEFNIFTQKSILNNFLLFAILHHNVVEYHYTNVLFSSSIFVLFIFGHCKNSIIYNCIIPIKSHTNPSNSILYRLTTITCIPIGQFFDLKFCFREFINVKVKTLS